MRQLKFLQLSGLMIIGICATLTAEEPAAQDGHVLEIEQWRQERRASLEKPDGWFSLVGLVWLEEGESTCGSDPSSTVRLPDSAPARIGAFHKSAEGVDFEAAQGTAVTIGDQKAGRASLAVDTTGDPTLIEIGSVQLYLIERDQRIGVRIKDSQSSALLAFEGLENFTVDPRWRIEARFVPYDPPKQIAVPTVLGTIAEQPSPGAVEFRMAARDHRLDVLDGGDGQVFIVFGDASNGRETYGGGRFLYAAEADDSGRIVLDFNKAYNPPCAFSPFATCPLPPRQNRLALAVRAGEMNYSGEVDH